MSIKRRTFLKGCAGAAALLGFSREVTLPAHAAEWKTAPPRSRLPGRLRATAAQGAPVLGKDAEPLTQQLNDALLDHLPFDTDRQDYADALRGLIAVRLEAPAS